MGKSRRALKRWRWRKRRPLREASGDEQRDTERQRYKDTARMTTTLRCASEARDTMSNLGNEMKKASMSGKAPPVHHRPCILPCIIFFLAVSQSAHRARHPGKGPDVQQTNGKSKIRINANTS